MYGRESFGKDRAFEEKQVVSKTMFTQLKDSTLLCEFTFVRKVDDISHSTMFL